MQASTPCRCRQHLRASRLLSLRRQWRTRLVRWETRDAFLFCIIMYIKSSSFLFLIMIYIIVGKLLPCTIYISLLCFYPKPVLVKQDTTKPVLCIQSLSLLHYRFPFVFYPKPWLVNHRPVDLTRFAFDISRYNIYNELNNVAFN